jgi:hypothetical protein
MRLLRCNLIGLNIEMFRRLGQRRSPSTAARATLALNAGVVPALSAAPGVSVRGIIAAFRQNPRFIVLCRYANPGTIICASGVAGDVAMTGSFLDVSSKLLTKSIDH